MTRAMRCNRCNGAGAATISASACGNSATPSRSISRWHFTAAASLNSWPSRPGRERARGGLSGIPATRARTGGAIISHTSNIYEALKDELVTKQEGLRRDAGCFCYCRCRSSLDRDQTAAKSRFFSIHRFFIEVMAPSAPDTAPKQSASGLRKPSEKCQQECQQTSFGEG